MSHISQLKESGYTVVENVIPDSELDAISASIQASTDEHGGEDPRSRGIGHVGGFMRYNQALAPYLSDRRVLDPVEGILGPVVKISFTTATINLAGNPRGTWHADWPFNQNNAGHVEAPYPDLPMHITTLWMISEFSAENGGTLIVPSSHREPNNPTGDIGVDQHAEHPDEINATGPAGSVLILDSRIWHSTAPNMTDQPRVSVVVRYAPWWLNTRMLMPDSNEREVMMERTGLNENSQPSLPRDVYEGLPETVQPLFGHWLSDLDG
ncbi:MAG: hypothetical protein CME19_02920 [Gemmatimonadetes bacterium]|nr:hypothetical protein [Gemmatimonadota bacterium]